MKNFYQNKELNEITNEIIKYMPTMSAYYGSSDSLSQYSKRIKIYKPDTIYLKRQSHFKQKLREKINRIFNAEEQKEINLRIDDNWGVIGGIVDHHGILDHPILLSVNLVSNFYKLFNRKKYGDILTFATANVPLNEPFRRRGFMFHGKKYNLYPKACKNKVIYGLGKYNFDLKQRIITVHKWHLLSLEEQVFLEKIDSIIKKIDFSTCRTIGDQISKINFYLWPYLFEEKIRNQSVNLISLEYDDLVVDYLIHVISNDSKSYICKMLFDKSFRDIILTEFEGNYGAWNQEKQIGTHFFWALDKNNERTKLKIKENSLVGKDFVVNLTPDEIISKLKEKKILPGMLLKFSLIVFYMGMEPLMGYSLEYMTRLKNKMIEILKKYYPLEAARIDSIPYNNVNTISVCKEKDKNDKIIDAPAFDIFYQCGFSADYFKKLDLIPYKDFLISFLPWAYDYAVDKYGNPGEKKKFNLPEEKFQEPFEILFK